MNKRPTWVIWLILALAFRLVTAWTHSSWAHPDEWYQTVEFASIFVRGFGTYSQEVELHLRNLSWPALLALPIWLAEWLSPGWIHFRFFSFQLFTGLLDLGMLWGFWQHLRPLPRIWQNFGFALIVLPYFLIHDSIRPSGEHLSIVALWISLGLLERKLWLAAGFATVSIAAFKYPAGLFSLGILGAVLLRRPRFDGVGRFLIKFLGGCALGMIAFGLADWWVYGRPWESLWMYSLYNVFSGAGTEKFGSQPLSEYANWITYRWLQGPLAPLWIVLAPSFIHGFWIGIRRRDPWAMAFVFYLLPHLLISHKEGRFLWPLEGLWLWGALLGLSALWPRLQSWIGTRPSQSPSQSLGICVRWIGIVILTLNSGLVLRELWGETFKANSTYFELNRLLRETPDACAVVTIRNPPSLMMPSRAQLAFAYAPMDKGLPSFDNAAQSVLHWAEIKAECKPSEKVLLHLYKPDPRWAEVGCELMESGLLWVLPQDRWDWAISKGWVSGPWYRCDSAALNRFMGERVEEPFATGFPKLATLPSLATPKEELLRTSRCARLCF